MRFNSNEGRPFATHGPWSQPRVFQPVDDRPFAYRHAFSSEGQQKPVWLTQPPLHAANLAPPVPRRSRLSLMSTPHNADPTNANAPRTSLGPADRS